MKMFNKNAMILRNYVGEATASDGTKYEMAYDMAGQMLVKSDKTGKTFAMHWQDVIDKAIEQGVDNDDEIKDENNSESEDRKS